MIAATAVMIPSHHQTHVTLRSFTLDLCLDAKVRGMSWLVGRAGRESD
jgi:hypothetical protein